MALTKVKVINQIEITESGIIQVREATRILEDGVQVAPDQYHRSTIEPDADITALPDKVKKVCQVIFTPEVIAAHKAKKAQKPA